MSLLLDVIPADHSHLKDELQFIKFLKFQMNYGITHQSRFYNYLCHNLSMSFQILIPFQEDHNLSMSFQILIPFQEDLDYFSCYVINEQPLAISWFQ